MIKRVWMGLLILAMGLAACQAGQAQPSSAPTTGADASVAPTKKSTSPTVTAGQISPPGCTVVSPKPTPGPTQESLFPPVSKQDWVQGPSSAAVTLIEYGDFQDAVTAQLEPILEQLKKDLPQDLRVVFRNLPLIGTPQAPFHDKAALAAQAAQAAGAQGKFWEMHDLLLARQADWANMTVDQFKEWLQARAADSGLDKDKFSDDLVSAANVAAIQSAWDKAQAINLTFTPLLLINGQPLANNFPVNYRNLSDLINLTLLEKRQFTACPAMKVDPGKQYIATLHTEKGDIVLQLYPDKAPVAVNNFVFLARQGWYDGTTFHRVLPGYIAQGGDPSASGYGTPGYAFDNEISPDLKFDRPGLLAMANAGPGTNGSQFFITMAPAPNLDGGYTIFGEVASGMEVVNSLTPRDPSKTIYLPPGDKITSVTIEEK
jgi:cyclophilin family peptidyl-prolyl cis-trans isomerase/protein-disulfide isomerase